MSKAEEHFETEPPHTKIKHQLFEATLNSCVSISNNFNNRQKEKRKFLYMDLYAGCGKFNDDNLGSPLIALKTINKQLKSSANNFNEVNFVVSEVNQENANKLKQNIEEYTKINELESIVKCSINAQSWEDCNEKFTEFIDKSKWGFLFIDPFSTELKLPKLVELISKNQYFKDVLILINNNAHERVLGREDEYSLQKISDYFGVDIKIIKKLKNIVKTPSERNITAIIQYLISRSFKNLNKDFIINLAITRTREGKLEDANRFYLCLITSSIGVANVYLETYAKLLNEKNTVKKGGQLGLFDRIEEVKYFELSDKINKLLLGQTLTLYRLVVKLYNDFFSWKNASPDEIPTSTNIQKAINILLDKNSISLLTTHYVNKTKIKSGTINLTIEAFEKKDNMKRVTLKGQTT